MIVFYHGESELCVFWNVAANQEIACSVLLSPHPLLNVLTKYDMFYPNQTECKGEFDTSCSRNIYRQLGHGECDQLQVVGWEDASGHVCYNDII